MNLKQLIEYLKSNGYTVEQSYVEDELTVNGKSLTLLLADDMNHWGKSVSELETNSFSNIVYSDKKNDKVLKFPNSVDEFIEFVK